MQFYQSVQAKSNTWLYSDFTMITNGALPIGLSLFMPVTEAVFIFPSEMISLGLIGHLTAPFVRSSFCDPHIVEIAPPCGSY